jgi:LAS superfamily LD-carboxypeptidase LdcB
MLTIKDLNPKGAALSALVSKNLSELLTKVNQALARSGISTTVTSGYRTEEDHRRIYAEKARKKGLKVWNTPMGSKHLKGLAADLYDPNHELQKWCLENETALSEIGLWCEHFSDTPNWVHFQIVPPGSGNRFFKP